MSVGRAVVDNQMYTLKKQIDGRSVIGVLSWSLVDTQAPDRPMFRATSEASHPDGTVVAADVALEILTDQIYIEVTRGFRLTVHDYSVMEGRSEVLRGAMARSLAAEVREYAFGFKT